MFEKQAFTISKLTTPNEGTSHGFHSTPFWKQWNALLQVNIEKNRHHGVYVIPASSFYYPPAYGGYGLYSPYNFDGIGGVGAGGGGAGGHRPILFDEYKVPATTLV